MKNQKKFALMSVTYSLGVFNDHFFKQAAMLLAVAIGKSEIQGTATILFSLPFILFSAHAGWLADRYSKRNVVVFAKWMELIAMIIGVYALVSMNWTLIVAVVFLMGAQSTIFGPSLNGSIPEIFKENQITRLLYIPR